MRVNSAVLLKLFSSSQIFFTIVLSVFQFLTSVCVASFAALYTFFRAKTETLISETGVKCLLCLAQKWRKTEGRF